MWNLKFVFTGSHKKFSLMLLQITNYIYSPWKIRKRMQYLKLFCYKVWILKLINFLMDSVLKRLKLYGGSDIFHHPHCIHSAMARSSGQYRPCTKPGSRRIWSCILLPVCPLSLSLTLVNSRRIVVIGLCATRIL